MFGGVQQKRPNENALQFLKRGTAITFNCVGICLCVLVPAGLAPGQGNNPPEGLNEESSAELSKQVVELRALVEKLQARVDELERRSPARKIESEATAMPASKPDPSVASSTADVRQTATQNTPSEIPAPRNGSDFLHGTTINLLFDGYYAYNFNNPIGRVNLLRAYDVSSNAFSLNQAALVIENAADPSSGKRFGARLDLQYGQATQTLQGNPVNEPRPDIYRNIFQAYGTYVFAIGNGLTVDFGKFASSLGLEGNYSKDQINYSRSFWFNFLPFYHTGLRVSYKLNGMSALNYWIVNGTQQTEPFNGFKDQFLGLTLQPAKAVSWNVNYYLGQEHPDVMYFPNGAPPNLPTQQDSHSSPYQMRPMGSCTSSTHT